MSSESCAREAERAVAASVKQNARFKFFPMRREFFLDKSPRAHHDRSIAPAITAHHRAGYAASK